MVDGLPSLLVFSVLTRGYSLISLKIATSQLGKIRFPVDRYCTITLYQNDRWSGNH